MIGKMIVVVGPSGSGKSTLAKALAKKLGLQHIELDALKHHANWTSNPNFREDLEGELDSAENGWVIDGFYIKTPAFELAWPQADTFIWLDLPLATCLWRVTHRSIKRGLFKEPLWNGNRESLRNFFSFSDRSMFVWVLKTHAQRRQDILDIYLSKQFSQANWIRLNTKSEVDKLTDGI